MKRYIISLAASRDLDEIINYFTQRDIEAGEKFITEFNKKCRNLLQFPNIGRSYADFVPLLRGVPIDSYIIFYKYTDDGIEIVRVLNGYRDLPSLFALPDEP